MSAAGDASVGTAPAEYAAVRALGQGRFGRVLHCRDQAGAELAVRILDRVPSDEATRALLESECSAAAVAGRHPCAVEITRVWQDDSLGVCTTQPFRPRGSLQQALDESGPLRPQEVVIGGLRVNSALAHSHRTGVLHGDVRPANVLLDEAGSWLLADGGLANAIRRASPTPWPLHDPRYAAREMSGWETPGPPADVHALGATMYVALVGHPPTAGSPGLPPEVPGRIANLVLRMLAADPADRPTSTEVDQVLRGLAPAAETARIPTPLPRAATPTPRPRSGLGAPDLPVAEKPGRRNALIAGGIITALFLAGSGAVIASTHHSHDHRSEAAAPVRISPSPAGSGATEPTSGVTPLRGTLGSAQGRDVDQGLLPYQIDVFGYHGRLAVLMKMKQVSADLKELDVYSVQADGSDSDRGDETFGQQKAGHGGAIPFFFRPGLSLDRCVQVQPVSRSGRAINDRRTVCISPLSDADRTNAETAWRAYRKLQQEKTSPPKISSPKPSSKPTRAV